MEFFNITIDENVAILRIHRPPVNAVSHQVYFELNDVMDEIENNDEARVVLFTGSPDVKAFCGGADLNEFMELDYESRLRRYDIVDKVLPRFGSFPKPIICAINGPAVGVGVALTLLTDIRLAANDIFFLIPEIDRGVVSNHLPKFRRLNVPDGIAKEWILTARKIRVAEAERYGVVNRVCEPELLFDEALFLAKRIAKKSKDALKFFKISFVESESMPWIEAYKKSHEYSAQLTAHQNSKEGIKAFFEKRAPEYKD